MKENHTSQLEPLEKPNNETNSEFDNLEQLSHKIEIVSKTTHADDINKRCSKTESQVLKILQKLEALEKKLK